MPHGAHHVHLAAVLVGGAAQELQLLEGPRAAAGEGELVRGGAGVADIAAFIERAGGLAAA